MFGIIPELKMNHQLSIYISVVLFGLAWSVSTNVPNRCPQPTPTNPDPQAFYYVHPDNCSYFFTCAHGTPYLMPCETGTRFSEVFQTCTAEFSHYDTCSRDNAARECSRGATLIGHPEICQRYFNCSDTTTPGQFSFLKQYESECPYPQLFDITERRCKSFKEAYCGPFRVPGVAPCSYVQNLCVRGNCVPCIERFPSCAGLASGNHEHPFRLWSQFYISCDSERTVDRYLTCPSHPAGGVGIFSPITKTCVSVWEVPRDKGGLQPSCVGKSAGQYVTSENPVVYYSCPGATVSYCPKGTTFNVGTKQCA